MKVKYSKELLESIVKDSQTWAEVCRKIGVKALTGSQTYVKNKAKIYEIDSSHFIGKAFNKGKSFKRRDALEYCFNGSTENSDRLKKKLIRDGYKKAECENCTWTHWMGKPLVLELHHIDNNHTNNELSNLEVLCPNCHSLKTRENK